jgi:Ion channel
MQDEQVEKAEAAPLRDESERVAAYCAACDSDLEVADIKTPQAYTGHLGERVVCTGDGSSEHPAALRHAAAFVRMPAGRAWLRYEHALQVICKTMVPLSAWRSERAGVVIGAELAGCLVGLALAGLWNGMATIKPNQVPFIQSLPVGLALYCLVQRMVQACYANLVSQRPAHRLRAVALTFFSVPVIATAFSVFYVALGNRFNSGCLGRVQALYFSFTTLLTVGYGDITPRGRLGQLVAISEMLVGVLIIAILLAVVGGWSYSPPAARQLVGTPRHVADDRSAWLKQWDAGMKTATKLRGGLTPFAGIALTSIAVGLVNLVLRYAVSGSCEK